MSESEPEAEKNEGAATMPEAEPQAEKKKRFRLPATRLRLAEFTLVVLGVFIALGLESLIQEARFRADARELERAFVEDIANAVIGSMERQAISPCLIQRLEFLADLADAAAGELEPPDHYASSGANRFATRQIYRSPIRIWMTSSFDHALGSEAFRRIPSEKAVNYTELFALTRRQDAYNNAEYLAAMGLAPLAYSQPEMSAELRADALQHLSSLDRHQRYMTLVSGQILERALNSPVSEDVRRLLATAEWDPEPLITEVAATYGDCADLTAFERLQRAATP